MTSICTTQMDNTTVWKTSPIKCANEHSPATKASQNTSDTTIVGTFVYYARSIDTTILMALGSLASQQAQDTTDTANSIVHFLNYCATYLDAIVYYYHICQ